MKMDHKIILLHNFYTHSFHSERISGSICAPTSAIIAGFNQFREMPFVRRIGFVIGVAVGGYANGGEKEVMTKKL